jgi:hypothetical protein
MGSRELEKNADKVKLLGSVTRRVSEIAEYPVLIIK